MTPATKTRPILTSPLPKREVVTGEDAEANRHSTEAILARIRQSLPEHLAPIQKHSLAVTSQPKNTLPAWKQKAIGEMPSFNSEPLAKLHAALARATSGMKQRIASGPRDWDQAQKCFTDAELTDDEAKAIKWAGKAARMALDERDVDRLTRSIRVMMSMPTSGDRIDSDSAEAWLMLLADLPIWAAEAACVDYARANKWRPSPSDIIGIAERKSAFVRRLDENAKELEAMA